MKKPLIAITGFKEYGKMGARICVNESYVRAVEQGGGLPLLITDGMTHEAALELLDMADGLVIIGGGDFDARLFGEEPHPTTDAPDKRRDEHDLLLAKRAFEKDMPILGICRGFQAMVIALGGTLYQNLPSQHPSDINHARWHTIEELYTKCHTVKLTENGVFHNIMGETEVGVNSSHHQAVKDLPSCAVAEGITPDGLVEAFVLPEKRFAIATQWHPERMTDYPEHLSLFKALVAACVGDK